MRRYDGNSGRYIHIPDESGQTKMSERGMQNPERQEMRKEGSAPQNMGRQKAMPPPNQIGSGLQNVLFNIFAQGFEVEDLLLFAVLFLMYQETKDKELLIIMGGMFLM